MNSHGSVGRHAISNATAIVLAYLLPHWLLALVVIPISFACALAVLREKTVAVEALAVLRRLLTPPTQD